MATSVSKGRGRGRGLLLRDGGTSQPVRPGSGDDAVPKQPVQNGSPQSSSSRASRQSVTEIHDVLKNLTLDVSDHEYEQIEELAKASAQDESDVKKLAEIVYSKCVSDREFAKVGACLCDKLSLIEANGTKFRSCLLNLVQVDYKKREEIRSRSSSRFLNVFSFMCQLFGTMRTATGDVFKPLAAPLYDYIFIIADDKDSSDDEFECLSLQLQAVGKELEVADREKMNCLMEKVRSILIREGSAAQTRCLLLELFECYCRSWKELNNDITRFYCDTTADILSGLVE